VSEHASVQAPSKLGLRPGQTIAVEDAIRAMVTKSANDVAVVVAEAIGGSEGEFANLMTKKAHALGMSHTVYRNASGLPNDEQVTTAREQALLGRAIQERFPRQYRYFSTPSFTYHGQEMRNHNNLLGHVEGVDGIKTGYTQASGFNLVTSVHRKNRYIVAVVLGGASAGERDAHMRALIEAHIASASTKHTATAIVQAVGAKTEKPVAAAKAEARYTVAAFAPPTDWPEPKFVPAADAPTDTVPAAAVLPAVELAAAYVSGTNKPPPITKSAALVDVNATIKPIQVKTIKAKLTQIQTAELGPVVVRIREEPTEPAPVEAPPKASAPVPKTAATAAHIARSAAPVSEPTPAAALRLRAPASASEPTATPSAAVAPVVVAVAPVVPPETVAPEAIRIVAAQSAPTHGSFRSALSTSSARRDSDWAWPTRRSATCWTTPIPSLRRS
jgi:D-alanyl-D-alanine carboxypeptidase